MFSAMDQRLGPAPEVPLGGGRFLTRERRRVSLDLSLSITSWRSWVWIIPRSLGGAVWGSIFPVGGVMRVEQETQGRRQRQILLS